eukprot:2892005-Amphidinium_carterae.2
MSQAAKTKISPHRTVRTTQPNGEDHAHNGTRSSITHGAPLCRNDYVQLLSMVLFLGKVL